MESRDLLAIGYMQNNDTETLMFVGLTNGTYAGVYRTITGTNSSTTRDILTMEEMYGDDKILMVSADNNGVFMWVYDISQSSFSVTYYSTTQVTAAASRFGYVFFASHNSGTLDPTIYKRSLDDTLIRSQAFIVDNVMETPAAPTPPSSTGALLSVSGSRTLSNADPSVSTVTTLSTNELGFSPINYMNSSYQTIYVPVGGTNTISIRSPCLTDTSMTLSGTLTTNQNSESSPSWVTLAENFTSITADASDISSGTYYMGVQFNYSNETYTMYSTLELFECGISNCVG